MDNIIMCSRVLMSSRSAHFIFNSVEIPHPDLNIPLGVVAPFFQRNKYLQLQYCSEIIDIRMSELLRE